MAKRGVARSSVLVTEALFPLMAGVRGTLEAHDQNDDQAAGDERQFRPGHPAPFDALHVLSLGSGDTLRHRPTGGRTWWI